MKKRKCRGQAFTWTAILITIITLAVTLLVLPHYLNTIHTTVHTVRDICSTCSQVVEKLRTLAPIHTKYPFHVVTCRVVIYSEDVYLNLTLLSGLYISQYNPCIHTNYIDRGLGVFECREENYCTVQILPTIDHKNRTIILYVLDRNVTVVKMLYVESVLRYMLNNPILEIYCRNRKIILHLYGDWSLILITMKNG